MVTAAITHITIVMESQSIISLSVDVVPNKLGPYVLGPKPSRRPVLNQLTSYSRQFHYDGGLRLPKVWA